MNKFYVWVCETGDYEQRYVHGVYTSPEAALISLKEEYGPPYRVTWGSIIKFGENQASIVGTFEAVYKFSANNTANYDLTRMPLLGMLSDE